MSDETEYPSRSVARRMAVMRETETRPNQVSDEAWSEGYSAAHTMARIWGHVDYWEDEPENPYDAAAAPTEATP